MDIQTSLVAFINDGLIAGKSQTTLKAYQYAIRDLLKYITGVFASQHLKCLNKTINLNELFCIQNQNIGMKLH